MPSLLPWQQSDKEYIIMENILLFIMVIFAPMSVQVDYSDSLRYLFGITHSKLLHCNNIDVVKMMLTLCNHPLCYYILYVIIR